MTSNFASTRRGGPVPARDEMLVINVQANEQPDVVVSHIEPDGTIFVQLVKWAAGFNDLMSKLNVEMSRVQSRAPCPPKGCYCAAKSALDGYWYRGHVVEVLSTGVVVRHLDFGNDEQLPPHDVQPLRSLYTSLPIQGIPCRVDHLSASLPNGVGERLLIEASSEILDMHFQLWVKRDRNLENPDLATPADFFLVADGRPSTNLLEMLLTRKKRGGGGSSSGQRPSATESAVVVQPQPSFSLGSVVGSTEPFRPLDLPVNRQHNVTIVYVQSPEEFWCQLVEEASVLEQLMDFLQLAFDQRTLRELELWPPHPRQAVAARFTDDDAWYRAVVASLVEGGKAEVLFVDFGNKEVLGRDRLMLLPPQLLQYPAMGFCCTLDDVIPASTGNGIGAGWGDDAVDFLQELTQEKLVGNIVGRLEASKQLQVRLFRVDESGSAKNSDIAEEMVRRGIAIRRPSPANQQKIAPSGRPQPHQSPRAPQHQSFQQQRHQNNNYSQPSTPRALTSTAHAATHGVVSPRQQRQLQQQQQQQPPPSKQQNQQQHPRSRSFAELPPCALGQVADVMIAWVKDPSEVYVQLVSQEEQLLEISRKLEEVYSQLESGQHGLETVAAGASCVAQFSQDDVWYRAVVQEVAGRQVVVKFVDFGNTDTTTRSTLKEIHPELLRYPVMAVRCALLGIESAAGIAEWTDAATEFLENLCGDDVIRCSFVGPKRSEGSLPVDLVVNGKNVAEELCRAGLARVMADDTSSNDSGVTGPPQARIAQQSMINSSNARVNANHAPGLSRSASNASEAAKAAPTVTVPSVPLSEKEYVIVTHVDNLANFWAQRVSCEEALGRLMDDIADFYADESKNRSTVVNKIANGTFCAALYSEDDQWYRAVITKTYSPQQVEVHYIDYGNRENVALEKIRSLRPEFAVVPSQAHLCALHGLPSAPNLKDKLGELTGNGDISFWLRVMSSKDGKCQVILDDSEDAPDANDSINARISAFLPTPAPGSGNRLAQIGAISTLATAAASEDQTSTSPQRQQPEVTSFRPAAATLPSMRFPPQPFPSEGEGASGLGPREVVFVTYVDSPSEFYVQLSRHNDAIDAMMGELEAVVTLAKQMPFGALTEGMPVCAKYAEDDNWYRALVETVDHDHGVARVFFVDFGNRQTLNAATSSQDIKPLAPIFIEDMPPHAFRCSLCLSTEGVTWSDEDVIDFKEATLEKEFSATFHRPASTAAASSSYVIQLRDGETIVGEDFANRFSSIAKSAPSTTDAPSDSSSAICPSRGSDADEVSSSPYSRITLPPAGDKLGERYHPVFISFCQSPSSFYLQLRSAELELEELMDAIASAAEDSDLSAEDSLEVGDPCIAVSELDGQWYRGLVVEKRLGQIKCRFVDYGNADWIDVGCGKLQSLSRFPDLLAPAAFAVSTSLHGIKADRALTMKERFESIIDDMDNISARFHPSGGDPCFVRLRINGRDVSQVLLDENLDLGSARSLLMRPAEGIATPVDGDRQSSSSSPMALMRAVSVSASPSANDDEAPSTFSRPETPAHTDPSVPSDTDSGASVSLVYPPAPATTLVAYMSQFESIESFYVQPVDRLDALTCLAESLNDRYNRDDAETLRLPQESSVEVGDVVCARWSEDDHWYRARIREVQENIVRVIFEDYGNSELVQLSDLRSLEPRFLTPPVFTFRCQLTSPVKSSCPNSSPWIEGAEAIAEDKTDDVDILVHFVEEDRIPAASATEDGSERVHTVVVEVDGQDLAKMLLKPDEQSSSATAAVSISPDVSSSSSPSPSSPLVETASRSSKLTFDFPAIPDEKVVVTLSHVENLRNVYFHPHGNDVKLMSLASILDQAYMGCEGSDDGPQSLPDPQPGDFCVAKSPAEDQWCRAQIVSLDGTRARVRFVDYGHCDSVSLSHVRCVLASLPNDDAHAIGPLSLVPPEAEEKPDAVAKLQAIVDDQTQFSFEFCEVGGHIRLTSIGEGRDIVEILQLASAPCHPSPECGGALMEGETIQNITELVDKLSAEDNDPASLGGSSIEDASSTDDEGDVVDDDDEDDEDDDDDDDDDEICSAHLDVDTVPKEEAGGAWEVISQTEQESSASTE